MGSVFCGRLCRGGLRFAAAQWKAVSSVCPLKRSTPRGPSVVPVCFYGHDSALGRLLDAGEKDSENRIGQHSAVPVHKAEQDMLLIRQPSQPENARVLRVAVIGSPNAGKSTLANQLLGRKVFPVSKKVHTTRSLAQGVISEANTQIILLDTPGLTSPVRGKRHHLEKSLLQDPWKSMQEADFVLVLVDVSDHWTRNRLSYEVLKCLSQNPHLPAALVLNKVDLLKSKSLLLDLTMELTEGFVNGKKMKVKSRLKSYPNPEETASSRKSHGSPTAEATKKLAHGSKPGAGDTSDSSHLGCVTDAEGVPPVSNSAVSDSAEPHKESQVGQDQALRQRLKSMKGWPHFREVFMLSAVNREEVETLKRYVAKQAKPGPWVFHGEVLTDQTPQEICENIIREKLMECLPQEVPYSVTQSTELWEEGENGELLILQKLLVVKESHAKMLIGPGGQLISRISQEAGADLMNIFLCDVRLKLSVKVKK